MRINEGLFIAHGYQGRYMGPSGWPKFWKKKPDGSLFYIYFFPEEFEGHISEQGKYLVGKYSLEYGGGKTFTPDELPDMLIEFDKTIFNA